MCDADPSKIQSHSIGNCIKKSGIWNESIFFSFPPAKVHMNWTVNFVVQLKGILMRSRFLSARQPRKRGHDQQVWSAGTRQWFKCHAAKSRKNRWWLMINRLIITDQIFLPFLFRPGKNPRKWSRYTYDLGQEDNQLVVGLQAASAAKKTYWLSNDGRRRHRLKLRTERQHPPTDSRRGPVMSARR